MSHGNEADNASALLLTLAQGHRAKMFFVGSINEYFVVSAVSVKTSYMGGALASCIDIVGSPRISSMVWITEY